MEENYLIEKLREEYLERVDLNVKEKDEDTAKRYSKIFSFFILGLKMQDCGVMRLSLDIIRKYQESVYHVDYDDEETEGAIIIYSMLPLNLKKLEEGKLNDLNELSLSFSPFYGTPKEMYEMYRKADEKSAMRNLFDGVRNMIDALAYSWGSAYCKDSVLTEGVTAYFIPWLRKFWSLLDEKEDEFVASDFGYSSPLTETTNCLCDMTTNSVFNSSFDTLMWFVMRGVRRYGWKYEDENWLDGVLRCAIWHDNYHTFSATLGAAERLGEKVKIDTYPETSLEILRDTFSMGMCLPGSQEGEKAFLELLKHYNPSEAVIRLIYTPINFVHYTDDETPLCTAVKNSSFEVEKYKSLVAVESDLNPDSTLWTPPLAVAYATGNKKAVDALIALGADTKWKDENGNNLVHIALSLKGASLENVVALADANAFFERNNEGKTPLDCYFSSKERK